MQQVVTLNHSRLFFIHLKKEFTKFEYFFFLFRNQIDTKNIRNILNEK